AIIRREHGILAADDDAACGVARVLDVLTGRRPLDDAPAHAAREVHAVALYVGAAIAKDLEHLLVALDVDTDLLQDGVGVVLDQRETLLAQHLVEGNLACDERHDLHSLMEPGRALRLAPRTAARSMGGRLVRHRVSP